MELALFGLRDDDITAKVAGKHPGGAPNASEPDVEAGGEHQVVALVVGDILQGGLHIDVMVNVSAPSGLDRILATLMEAGILRRESAGAAAVGVDTSHLAISVAATGLTGVGRELDHAGDIATTLTPQRLLAISPPGTAHPAARTIGIGYSALVVDGKAAGVDGSAHIIAAATPGILQLGNIEDAIVGRTEAERVVVAVPAIVAHAIVHAVAKQPPRSAHIHIQRETREGIVGYRIARRDGGEEAARAVGEERCKGRGEEVFADIAHADEEARIAPRVPVAQHGDGCGEIGGLYIGEGLPVADNGVMGLERMDGGSLDRTGSVGQRHAEIESEEVDPVGRAPQGVLPLGGKTAAKALGLRADAVCDGKDKDHDSLVHHCHVLGCGDARQRLSATVIAVATVHDTAPSAHFSAPAVLLLWLSGHSLHLYLIHIGLLAAEAHVAVEPVGSHARGARGEHHRAGRHPPRLVYGSLHQACGYAAATPSGIDHHILYPGTAARGDGVDTHRHHAHDALSGASHQQMAVGQGKHLGDTGRVGRSLIGELGQKPRDVGFGIGSKLDEPTHHGGYVATCGHGLW